MSAVASAAAAVVVAVAPNPAHLGSLVTVTVHGTGAPSFAPFTVRVHHGGEYVLQCVQPACAPGAAPRTFVIGGARITVTPRATPAEVQRPLRSFRRETLPPAYSYRVSPDALRVIALVIAFALFVVAVGAVWPFLRRPRPEPRDERTALDLLRESVSRDAEDRRRALDLASRAAAQGDASRRVRDLAWSAPEPEPGSVARLADELERLQ